MCGVSRDTSTGAETELGAEANQQEAGGKWSQIVKVLGVGMP